MAVFTYVHIVLHSGWSDIGYNFLVGEDGRAYEGRGWDNQGAHATSWNSLSHGTCVIGDFTNRLPNAAALQAVDDLIDCGVQQVCTLYQWEINLEKSFTL